jgi:hypothetical protein
MTKNQVISELLTHVRTALDAKLTHEEYSEFLKGSVSFRLDLIRKPEAIFVNVNLPGDDPKLKVEFRRRYTRLVDRLDAIEK